MKNVTETLSASVTPEEKRRISGKRLRSCREKMGLTQEGLIERVMQLPENNGKERSEKQVGYIENGKRLISAEYARLFGKVLGVQPSYLLGETDYKTEKERLFDKLYETKQESNLLYLGLNAFAKLTNYEITSPNFSNAKTIEKVLETIKYAYKITKDNQTITLSLDEMNRFENEVCDIVELKLKHLFIQKAGEENGNYK